MVDFTRNAPKERKSIVLGVTIVQVEAFALRGDREFQELSGSILLKSRLVFVFFLNVNRAEDDPRRFQQWAIASQHDKEKCLSFFVETPSKACACQTPFPPLTGHCCFSSLEVDSAIQLMLD